MEYWRNGVLEEWRNIRKLLRNFNTPALQHSVSPLLRFPAPPFPRFSNGLSGFTLLEILIAIVIFATLLTTIYASYTGTFRVIEDTESQAEIYRMARIAMERMMEDLESVYIQKTNQPDSPEGEKESSLQFLGEEREMMGRRADALRFASSAHVDFSGKDPGYGATQISYYVKEINEGETFVLYRAENPLFKETYPFEEGSGGLVLCEGLTWISFTYYGEDGQASNNWDSTREDMKDKIPKTVSITLEFENVLNQELPIRFTTSVALPMEKTYL